VDIVHRELPRVDILAVTGRVQAPEAAQLQERINALFAEKRARILLDFEALDYISSGGLRVLVQARKTAQDAHGDVRIVHLPDQLRKVFDLVGLTTIFTFYDDMVEAVASF
jgi:anti-sigma B factor antagonist